MDLHVDEVYYDFKLIQEKYIEELKGIVYLFKHQKSGASLTYIVKDDPNKVFTIAFKTPPTNNSGVAHVVEHAVCCASEKYPLKDTFIELDKGSLNTSLNACTYKDMTMYYCASKNAKDFTNMIDVYMDLVFHPLIYSRPYLFKQEGWHYVLKNLHEEIRYNGIVYNEMKGEYGEPYVLLEHEVHKALFPDTLYCYDSGGIPEDIIKLTEEEFLAFHSKHYHPSNCSIYLYGDGDVLQHLALLNEGYLKSFSKQELCFDIPKQKPFTHPLKLYKDYPITLGENMQNKCILTLSFVVGEATDTQLRLALQILEHMLLKSAASPLAKALIEENNIGKALEEGGYDPGKRQPTFSIVLNGANSGKEELFERCVAQVLKQLVTQGIDEDLLEASIHTITFGLQETESPDEPKGILYSEDIQMSTLYGGNPLSHLMYKKHLDYINNNKKLGYFENLIKKYFLDNNHSVLLVLEPSKKLEAIREKTLRKNLKVYKKSLSKQQIKGLIEMNRSLDCIQEMPNTSEDLARLPSLSIEDIKTTIEPMLIREERVAGVKLMFNEQITNGIVYMHLLFDTTSIKQEDIPYIGILANVLTYLSTLCSTYSQLENKINRQTGGINCSINAYADCKDTDKYNPLFKITSKVLIDHVAGLMVLLEEIVTKSIFTEKAKIKEILSYIKYEMEKSFTSCPEYRVTRRLYTYFSASAVYEDLVSGMQYYTFVSNIYNHFERDFEGLAYKLKEVYNKIMQKRCLQVSVTADKTYYNEIAQQIALFVSTLPNKDYQKESYSLKAYPQNEAYLTANSVQAIAKGFNLKKYAYTFEGALYVISNIVNSTYLWDRVRLQGGAYGCDLTISRDGNVLLCSYCDPELLKTLNVYNEIGKYLREICLEDKELLKYIIGTIGGLDMPLTMEEKSEKAVVHDLCHITNELLQKERDQVLQTTKEDIIGFADLFDTLAQTNMLCVIGNNRRIKSHKILFENIVKL